MFKKYKKGFLFCFFIMLIFVFVPQINAETTINSGTVKFAHSEPEIDIATTPYYALSSVFKDIVERETQGRFKVDVYPGSQLGDIRSMTEQCARGTLELVAGTNTGLMASYYPEIQIFDIPYLFSNTEIGREVILGTFGDKIADEFRKVSGLKVLAWTPSALRNFVNTVREVRTPDDIKGMKIRTMEVPIHITMVEALGASATPIAWSELYVSLQTGVVDGNEQPPFDIIAAKLYEVEKYYTLDHHLLNINSFLVNDDFFNKLSKDDQRIFEYAARQAQFAFLGVIQATEIEHLKELEEQGMVITTLTLEEREQFRELAQPAVIEQLKEKGISPNLIDELLKAVEEAENKTGLR